MFGAVINRNFPYLMADLAKTLIKKIILIADNSNTIIGASWKSRIDLCYTTIGCWYSQLLNIIIETFLNQDSDKNNTLFQFLSYHDSWSHT